LGCALVQKDPAGLEAEFEDMPALGPGQIVNQIDAFRWVIVGGRPGEGTETGDRDAERYRR
jgi:hypothetical protein